MEVLSQYSPPPPSNLPSSPPPGEPFSFPLDSSSSSSILVRRLSKPSLHTQSELALSIDQAVLGKSNGHSSQPLMSVPRSARRSFASPRSFAPLTPIVASPITTPRSMSPSAIYLTTNKLEGAKEKLAALNDTHEQDYLTKGIMAPIPASNESAVRVVDASLTWTSTPPTPPPKAEYQSASSGAYRPCAPWEPLASLPASLNTHASTTQCSNSPRRRASLPLMMALTKPLPPTPPTPPSKSPPPRPAYHTKQLSWSSGSPSPLRDAVTASGDPVVKRKHKFHMGDDNSDREDEGEPWAESPEDVDGGTHEGTSNNEHSPEDGWLKEKMKDDIRRYHVLMELLSTEMGYLMDLRELVNGYIRQLPTLSCRPTASSSHFGSSSNLTISPFSRSPTSASFSIPSIPSHSRANSYSQLPVTSPASSAASPEGQAPTPPAKEKNATRYMFSDEEIELVTRNIEEILQFHEIFVDDLRRALKPLGFSMATIEDVADIIHSRQKKGIGVIDHVLEAAIAVVSKTFKTQASKFDCYETFCSGHPEAFDLVRKTQQEHAIEWDAFEQRSSNLVADMRKPVSYTQTVEGKTSTPSVDDAEHSEASRKRRHSLSSLDISASNYRSPHARSNTTPKHSTNKTGDTGSSRDKNSRLVFMDYLIKPVQRICKYPLLIDQLKVGKIFRGDVQEDGSSSASSSGESSNANDTNAMVELASQAMKGVASSVDEARRRQDISTKSSLIASRILNALSAHSSSLRSLVGHNITPAFLASLGASLLAGSVDVIHHHADRIPGSSGTVKAKYLGAFLYMGGYLILAKVSKGKIYEPRHWFSLASFELFDVPEEEALLPCSFRLSCKGHNFDIAAACQREKDVWISAFRESLTLHPTWVNEPVSSLQIDDRHDTLSIMTDSSPTEAIPPVPPLPTIQSIPELEGNRTHIKEMIIPAVVRTDASLPRALPRPDISGRQDLGSLSVPPSRRSSTVSVKAIFLPVSESTILIRRASPPARHQVERGLLDVFSDLCLSARYHANRHEEELFQAPKDTRSGFSRSSSGLMMTGMGVAAKNRLTKRESVLVQRRKSGVDVYGATNEGDVMPRPVKRSSTAKSLANRRHAKKLNNISVPGTLTSDGEGELLPDSPPALSQCSSITASHTGSVAGSPITDAILNSLPVGSSNSAPRPDLLVVREADCRPIRRRSVVDNVKGIFQSRSSSPTSSISGHQSLPPSPDDPPPSNNPPSLFRWWTGSMRRRVRSAPGAPEELPSFTSRMFSTSTINTGLPSPSILSVRRSKTTKERRSGYLSANENGQLRNYSASAEATASEPHIQHLGRPSPSRRRSLFSSSTSRRQMMASTGDEPVPKLQRNMSFFRRLSPLTSTPVSPSPEAI